MTKEGGAREETGGSRNRRSLAGPRPQLSRWPKVEPTEGEAMVAYSRGLTNGGRVGGGGARGGELKSKGDGEDPGDQGE